MEEKEGEEEERLKPLSVMRWKRGDAENGWNVKDSDLYREILKILVVDGAKGDIMEAHLDQAVMMIEKILTDHETFIVMSTGLCDCDSCRAHKVDTQQFHAFYINYALMASDFKLVMTPEEYLKRSFEEQVKHDGLVDVECSTIRVPVVFAINAALKDVLNTFAVEGGPTYQEVAMALMDVISDYAQSQVLDKIQGRMKVVGMGAPPEYKPDADANTDRYIQ